MSENVTVKSATAFKALVDDGTAPSDLLITMGKAIGYSSEDVAELYPELLEDEDDNVDDID